MTGMISAIILTKNSEQTIRRTVESVKWCGEVIVIDDDSEDQTAEIARIAGATILSRHVEDDFASQRNAGLARATGEWVFFVDSDEVVTPALQEEIEVRVGKEKGIAGYFIRRADFLFGKELRFGETSRVKLLRLAQRNAGLWERPVHEEWHVTGAAGELVNPLLHYSHQNVAQFLEKINYYSTLNAKHLYNEHVRVSWWHIPAYPAAKFLKNYLLYQGFRDGTEGAICALMMSFHSFLTRAKLWQLWDSRKA